MPGMWVKGAPWCPGLGGSATTPWHTPGSSQGQGQKHSGIDPAAVLTSWSGEIARDTSSCGEMMHLDHNYLSYQH